jgi:hypothetical protein
MLSRCLLDFSRIRNAFGRQQGFFQASDGYPAPGCLPVSVWILCVNGGCRCFEKGRGLNSTFTQLKGGGVEGAVLN